MTTQQQQQQQQQHPDPPRKIDLSALQDAEIERAKPGPQSPQLEKDAARAMAHTESWQPALAGRAEGYRPEDHRHEIMMGSVGARQGMGMGMGFSEGRSA